VVRSNTWVVIVVSYTSQTVEGEEEMIEVDHGKVEAVDTEVIQKQMS
jgi:hypothetical protein